MVLGETLCPVGLFFPGESRSYTTSLHFSRKSMAICSKHSQKPSSWQEAYQKWFNLIDGGSASTIWSSSPCDFEDLVLGIPVSSRRDLHTSAILVLFLKLFPAFLMAQQSSNKTYQNPWFHGFPMFLIKIPSLDLKKWVVSITMAPPIAGYFSWKIPLIKPDDDFRGTPMT